MPTCTSCTHPTPYLYTVYESAYNLRLEQCAGCHAFADPYVEHDTLILVLDLILLKRGVYRHLLYNRGSEPRYATGSGQKAGLSTGVEENVNSKESEKERLRATERQREMQRWWLIFRLGCGLIAIDAFIRWSHYNPNQPVGTRPWTRETLEAFSRTLVGCFIETVAFHGGIIIFSFIMLNILDWVRNLKGSSSTLRPSAIRKEFRFSLIPLTIFYSSLNKLFLLFLLSIWRPASNAANSPNRNGTFFDTLLALEIFDQDNHEWLVRNVLGGMSAGFGLRVILDCHPIFTTIIILGGWAVKTGVGNLVSGWVGGDEKTGEAWLAYSIP